MVIAVHTPGGNKRKGSHPLSSSTARSGFAVAGFALSVEGTGLRQYR
jgi:hypothetical protein